MYDKTRKLYGLIGLTVVIKNVIIKMPKGSVATSHFTLTSYNKGTKKGKVKCSVVSRLQAGLSGPTWGRLFLLMSIILGGPTNGPHPLR